jgi:hypothetical protein
MSYKIGQELYTLSIEDDGKCSIETYKVRTIRHGFVYAILVASFTWGKKSTRHGDFGWLDPINSCFRQSCKIGEKFHNLHTTKRGAWAYPGNLDWIDDSDPEEARIREKIKKTIKSALSRLSNKKGKT